MVPAMNETFYRTRRSLIFTDGMKPEMFAKALKTGADMVCVDLEDAIAPEHKDQARDHTLPLFALDGGPVERLVRINGLRTAEGLADLLAIIASPTPPPALMLPKIKSPDEIRLLDELLGGRHAAIRFHVIIETNEGLEACHEIASSSPRMDSLVFGSYDMAADLRVESAWNTLLYARSRVVHAAASAGLDLIDAPYLDFEDEAGLDAAAAAAATLGMTGKAAVHPRQIPIINRHFTPTPEAVARARRVIGEFEAGDGGLVVIDGKLIEKPVLRAMYRTLAVADRTGG
jgi:citrate lyase beta subunit